MSYQPIIYKLLDKKQNPLEIINHFISSWYEIDHDFQNINSFDFGKLFGIKISKEINLLLNYLTHLNYTIVRGKKRIAYTAIQYLFPLQNLKIGYDKELQFLFLFQEGGQDFYYGIPYEHLQEENPAIFRLVKYKDISLIRDSNIIDFLISHIAIRATKVGIKGLMMFISNEEESKKVEDVCNLYEYKIAFENFTIFEKENSIAAIDKKEKLNMHNIFIVNNWSKENKDFSKQVSNMLG